MATRKREDSATPERILKVASKLFAEKGFRGTTVEMICRGANANIAAVNYHFRSKENLYQQAWRHAHDQVMTQFPPNGGVATWRPATERLHGMIHAGLQRAILGDAIEWRIVRNEIANPTGLLRQVVDDAIGPIRRAFQQVLRELMGSGASDRDVELCEMYVVAPLTHALHHRQRKKEEGLEPSFTGAMLNNITGHFTRFALAGIDGIRHSLKTTATHAGGYRAAGPRKTGRQS